MIKICPRIVLLYTAVQADLLMHLLYHLLIHTLIHCKKKNVDKALVFCYLCPLKREPSWTDQQQHKAISELSRPIQLVTSAKSSVSSC